MNKLLIPITERQAIIFACFFVIYEFLTYISNDMIMPGMINVMESFDAPESCIPTSLAVYILGGASLQLILGPLSDNYGRRPIMLIGATIFFVFTLLLTFSNSINQFMAARFFQGMGLCFIAVTGYATIQEIFDEMDSIRIIALMANVSILAPLLGPFMGAIVIRYTSWRYIFLSIALGALITLWGLWKYMPEPINVKENMESNLNTRFLANKICGNYRKLFSNKKFCLATLALSAVDIPCLAWIGLSPVILMVGAKLSVMQYALLQIPIFGVTILGNWFLNKLTYIYKIKHIILFGSFIMTIGAFLTSFLPYFFGNAYYLIIPGMIIYFFSLSLINAPLNRYCLFVTSVSKGTASAIISLSIMILGAIGTELAGLVYQNHNILYFALYCNLSQIIYFIFAGFALFDEYHP